MKNVVRFVIAVWAGLSVSGCATIVSGTTQKLSVSSRPTGATATIDNNISAKTPALLTLDRKSDHTLVVSKEGFKNQTVFIKRTMNGMGFGNVLVGGIIGVGIDAASG